MHVIMKYENRNWEIIKSNMDQIKQIYGDPDLGLPLKPDLSCFDGTGWYLHVLFKQGNASCYKPQTVSNMTRSSLYTNCLNIISNLAPLGCGEMGNYDHYRSATDKFTATVWFYHDNMDYNLWRVFQTPLWINQIQISVRAKGSGNPELERHT